LLDNLLLLHSTRWGVLNYNTESFLSRNLRRIGCFSQNGRMIGVCPDNVGVFGPTELSERCDFYLVIAEHPDEESAAANYMTVNRSSMSMCLPIVTSGRYWTVSVVPSGLKIYNSSTPCGLKYLSGGRVLFREINSAIVSTRDILSALSSRVQTTVHRPDFFSHRDGYQRSVGGGNYIEDEDHFLVSMAELVRGAWAESTSDKLYTMFLSWIRSKGNPSPADMRRADADFKEMKRSSVGYVRVRLAKDISLTWQWLRMAGIVQGPNISSRRVTRILEIMKAVAPRSGVPAAATTLPRESVKVVAAKRGAVTLDGVELFECGGISDHLYKAPEPVRVIEDVQDDFGELDNLSISDISPRGSVASGYFSD